MNPPILLRALPVALVLLAAGCAARGGEVRIPPPAAAAMTAPTGTAIVLRSVTDARETAPLAAPPARTIGRRQGAYGEPEDVLLPRDQTVEAVVREHVAAALRQAGHRVVEPDQSTLGPPLLVDVRITSFWCTLERGFAASEVVARIATELKLDDGTTLNVGVTNEERRAFVSEITWEELIASALRDFRTQLWRKSRGLKPPALAPRTAPLQVAPPPPARMQPLEPSPAPDAGPVAPVPAGPQAPAGDGDG